MGAIKTFTPNRCKVNGLFTGMNFTKTFTNQKGGPKAEIDKHNEAENKAQLKLGQSQLASEVSISRPSDSCCKIDKDRRLCPFLIVLKLLK